MEFHATTIYEDTSAISLQYACESVCTVLLCVSRFLFVMLVKDDNSDYYINRG